MIETWYNQNHENKNGIAVLLHKSKRTIRREIKQGLMTVRVYKWEDKYRYEMTVKGPELKLDKDIWLVEHIKNNNRRIKRWILKWIDISTIKAKHIQFIEDWINSYQRAIFDYNSWKMIKSINNLHFRWLSVRTLNISLYIVLLNCYFILFIFFRFDIINIV